MAIVIILLAEFFVLMQIIIFATNTDSSLRHVIGQLFMSGGLMEMEFWVGVVGIGFLIPLVAGFTIIAPKLIASKDYQGPRIIEALMSVAVLFGASMLIYILLFGGQLTGPVGI